MLVLKIFLHFQLIHICVLFGTHEEIEGLISQCIYSELLGVCCQHIKSQYTTENSDNKRAMMVLNRSPVSHCFRFRMVVLV